MSSKRAIVAESGGNDTLGKMEMWVVVKAGWSVEAPSWSEGRAIDGMVGSCTGGKLGIGKLGGNIVCKR
ncbi:hypothetical protein L484_008179 [Morus notabilis]|uniref:Uncharacterized protein n=1 Tax=Morus notabilis TaxID=981085 RepID=W9RS97_9ROSA|nr:hypothetical protein L484_008179 [Morus notabilis]